MHFLFKKGRVSEVFCLLFLPFNFRWRSEVKLLLLEQSMKTMFISWKDIFESTTREGISCRAAVTRGYSFGFSAENLSKTVPWLPVWTARFQIQVSSLLVAFALTVLALSQRQRDLTPSQATSGIKITLTSLLSVCWTCLVRTTWPFPSLKFSELPLASASGSKAVALCEKTDCYIGRVSSAGCLRARSSGRDSRRALRRKLPLWTVA